MLHVVQVCSECSEEFCSGTCKEFQYDAYQRLIVPEKEKEPAAVAESSGNTKGKKKGKKKGAKKKKRKPAGLARMPVEDA